MPEEPEYAEGEAWYVERNGGEGARADVFYVAPTCVWDWVNEAGETVHFEDIYNEEQREALRPSLELAADIFADSCRFYAPYYRQITLESWMEGEDTVNARFPYAMADVERAFDYYCTHLNEGRPFILAGFSQGGKAVVELLKRMPEEVYGRLVAAYAIGYKISREELAMYPNLRAAQDSTDTGVVICYNSVADVEAICPVLAPSDVCINPLNWRTDGTAAALNDGAAALSDGAGELTGGVRSLEEGISNLQSGADTLSIGLNELSGQSQSLRDGSADISSSLASLSDLAGRLALQTGELQMHTGTGEEEGTPEESWIEGQEELQGGLTELQSQLQALQEQMQTYEDSVSGYTAGVDEAANGSGSLADQIPAVLSGAESLSEGMDTLSGGITELKNGHSLQGGSVD